MLQNGVFGIRQGHVAALTFYAVGGEVHLQVPYGDGGLVLAPVLPIAAQQRIDFSQQLLMGEGLGEKIIPAAVVG